MCFYIVYHKKNRIKQSNRIWNEAALNGSFGLNGSNGSNESNRIGSNGSNDSNDSNRMGLNGSNRMGSNGSNRMGSNGLNDSNDSNRMGLNGSNGSNDSNRMGSNGSNGSINFIRLQSIRIRIDTSIRVRIEWDRMARMARLILSTPIDSNSNRHFYSSSNRIRAHFTPIEFESSKIRIEWEHYYQWSF